MDGENQRYRALFENAPVALFRVDISLERVVEANLASARIAGYDSVEDFIRLWVPGEHYADPAMRNVLLGELTRSGKVVGLEVELIRADGSTFWACLTITLDGDGRHADGMVIDITAARNGQEALRRSEERFRRLFEEASLGIFQTTFDGQVLVANPAYARMYGYDSMEDLKARDIAHDFYVHPEKRKGIVDAALASDQVVRFENLYKRKDGSTFVGDLHLRAVRDAGGKPLYLEGFVEDVSERHLAAEALRQSEHQYRTLMETASDAILVVDVATGTIVDCNNAAGLLLKRKPEDVVGMHNSELVPPDYRDERERQFKHRGTLDKSHVPEAPVMDSAGVVHWVSISNSTFESHGRRFMQGIFHDITERRASDLRLRESEERFRRAINDSPLPTIIFAEDFEVIQVNKVWTEITGYAPEELRTIDQWLKLAHGEKADEVARTLRGLFSIESRRHGGEYVIRTRDGSQRTWDFWATSLGRLPDGRRLVMSVAMDVTEFHNTEEQLRQAQKMEAVGRLAGGIAHDFNNQLTVVKGYCDLLLQRMDKDNPVYQPMEEIRQAATRAATLTSQLLTFSRQQVLRPEVLDLNAVLDRLANPLGRMIGEDIRLAVIKEPGLWRVKADPLQVEHAIMNLVVNARDAMPQGGKLTLETVNIELDAQYARLHVEAHAGPHVMLAATDTGLGMDARTLARVFDPFFTTKPVGQGTGLGLAMVYGFVRQSGGHVEALSELGVGTTFKIFLPRVMEDLPVESVEPVGESPRGSETILVAEDNEHVRQLLVRVLAGCGYTVLEAQGAEQALPLARERDGVIHLLVTDVIMPEMSGSDLAQRVKELRPGIRVLFITGYAENALVVQGLVDKGANILNKPFTADKLAQTVRDILGAGS